MRNSSIPFSQNETGFLLLALRLLDSGRPLRRETLLPFAELKLPGVARGYDQLVASLRERDLLEGTPEDFVLTQPGEESARAAAEKVPLNALFYDEYYQAVIASQAHARFCEQVYGLNLAQHGMADMDQVQAMVKELGIQPGMDVLDFGCGDGRISEYISDLTGAMVTGVDIAPHAIELAQSRTVAKRDRLQFTWSDIEGDRGSSPVGPFDRILAIDSLFFVRDQSLVLKALMARLQRGGQLGIFYHFPGDQDWQATRLAQALAAGNLPYRVSDFTYQNQTHWRKKKEVLLEMEAEFLAEGSTFLFKNRLAECEGLEDFRRYMLIVFSG